LIYFLLAEGDFSSFHRVRWSDEIWHLYAGGPLELHLIDASAGHAQRLLTTDLCSGAPTAVVPAGCWQAARLTPGTKWAFAGCTVSPGFEFSDFDMPPAAELLEVYPEHASFIRELTRR
jgi:predicted cupin superfamily sugar epimerase